MREYRERIGKLTTAKEKIKRWLTDQDVTLTADDVQILKRWEHVDKLMAQGITLTPLLRNAIMQEFSVSSSTADNDIFSAQEVFGESRRINRHYLGHLHLQDISADLTRIRQKLFEKGKDGKSTIPDHKEIQALSKLHDAYTYQLNSLPDDAKAPVVKRPIFMFSLVNGEAPKPPMQLADAMKIADEEFLNFEIIPAIQKND